MANSPASPQDMENDDDENFTKSKSRKKAREEKAKAEKAMKALGARKGSNVTFTYKGATAP